MTSTDAGEPVPPHATPPDQPVPGDQVHAWIGEALHHAGTVEAVAAELGIIWIREDGADGIGPADCSMSANTGYTTLPDSTLQ